MSRKVPREKVRASSISEVGFQESSMLIIPLLDEPKLEAEQCFCRVGTKIVVLIGETQNGKSSVVKSFLRYGGYEEEADKLDIGGGNLSKTQESTCFSFRDVYSQQVSK